MKCDEALPLLSDYAEGLLDTDERTVVETHLAGCVQCKAEAAIMAGFVERLRQIPERQAPAELRGLVMAGLHGATGAPSLLDRLRAAFTTPRFTLAAASLACILVALVVVPGLHSPGPPVVAGANRATTGLQVVEGTVEVDGVLVDASAGAVRVEVGQRLVVPRGGSTVVA